MTGKPKVVTVPITRQRGTCIVMFVITPLFGSIRYISSHQHTDDRVRLIVDYFANTLTGSKATFAPFHSINKSLNYKPTTISTH